MPLYVPCSLMERDEAFPLTLLGCSLPAIGCLLFHICQRKEAGHPLKAWDLQYVSLPGHLWCPVLHSGWHHTPVLRAGLHPPLLLSA